MGMTEDMGAHLFFEESAIAAMLTDGVCFVSGCDDAKVTIFVGCNDVFAGCADGEDLPLDQIKSLYEFWRADSKWGYIKWACQRRHLRPQWPIAKSMIRDGSWDVSMDVLPLRVDAGDDGWNSSEAQEWLRSR